MPRIAYDSRRNWFFQNLFGKLRFAQYRPVTQFNALYDF